MQAYLTGKTLANQVRMQRSAHPGAFLLVEGDTDARLFKHFQHPSCQTLPAHGREKLLEAVGILTAEGFTGLLAIADADFDRLEGRLPPAHVLFTDTHDLESMLLRSPALERLLDEHASEEKLQRLKAASPTACSPVEAVSALLHKAVRLLALWRWANHHAGLELDFKELDYGKVMDKRSLEPDSKGLENLLSGRCAARGQPGRAQQARVAVEALQARDTDPWQLSQGHDLVQALSLGLQARFGSQRASSVLPEHLERDLRLAFHRGLFQQTTLFGLMASWEDAHPSYRVLEPRLRAGAA